MSCFFNSGAEAVENAVKVARYVTRRDGVVAFERSFHGRTLMAMSLTGKVHPYTAGFGPFASEVYRLPYHPFFGRHKGKAPEDAAVRAACREALDRLFAYHVDETSVACILLEPVLGEGGFLPLQAEAARVIKEVCREAGILLIADEVQTGFGRTGYLFASEHFDLRPDIMIYAKSIGGGMPLSGISARSEILDAPHVGGIGGTFGGNPIACAAGNAVLDVMQEEDLPARARMIGARVMSVFDRLVASGGAAGDARGLGAMCGLEIVDPKSGAPDPERAKSIVARCLADGLLIMTASGTVLRTLMPLNIPEEDLERGLAILERAVRAAA
jgi:4-aminobutyrate aminotransferase/(S)-3-amino-2-methylpropionate transaminase